ncbi:putative lysophospholipase BODYGUARD 4 [Sesamum angolense]|uniref:Lysophospholipase BODYGUARD 4 n=1 Tax=Sesamum angolense TaxID=2727404 RepID=A0AAE1WFP1_9LAMI|nr:putative lysophospholipase BODYGUARD 4 [Sesamum angolense]
MSRVATRLPGKWLSRISETLISLASAIVFFFLDILDVVMCVFFRAFDEFLEGKSSSCYCMERGGTQEEEKRDLDSVGVDGECEPSESLRGRKNVFREMGLLRFSPRIWSKEGAFRVGQRRNRWSDCGCESCLSWMSSGRDSRLHVVVKEHKREFFIDSQAGEHSGVTTVQNVIFIHGFLSSSSLWTETVFPNLSEHSKQNYKLFAVDLLGFGRSPKPRDCLYTLKDHLEMIEKSVILPFQLKSFHLVAHSMGCVIALALAAKYSDSVKSITLIAPGILAYKHFINSPQDEYGLRYSWFSFHVMGTSFSDHDLTRHTHHSAWHTMHNVICGGARFLDKYLETLRAAGVKIRVVQGTEDQVVPTECSHNMKVKAPEIELEIVPNADHTHCNFRCFLFSGTMDFLATSEGQLAVGVAVGLVAVGAAYVLFSSKKPKVCLDPENFKEFKLVKKTQLSHNVAKFKFALPTPTFVLGLPIGQHISCKGKDSQGEDVIKPYTPTT